MNNKFTRHWFITYIALMNFILSIYHFVNYGINGKIDELILGLITMLLVMFLLNSIDACEMDKKIKEINKEIDKLKEEKEELIRKN